MHASLSVFERHLRVLDQFVAELERNRIPLAADLPLAMRLAELHKSLGAASSASVSKSRVEAAIQIAIKDVSTLQARHRFVLSHALAQPVDTLGGKSLLNKPRVVNHLLNGWESAALTGDLKLSHWRGLFRSYMQAPDGEWQQRLLKLLSRTIKPVVKQRKRRPAWLDTLLRHEHLLSQNPCRLYINELLAGEYQLLADLTEYIDIPATSWFWQQLKVRLFEKIWSMSESTFRASIESLLKAESFIPQVGDGLLKEVLERYESGKDPSMHRVLMDFALETWGSPQLERHRSWDICRPAVRQMVCAWLAKDDLEDFYRLCSSEQGVDERRLQFWLRFKNQMTFTQILLGARLRKSHDSDVKEFLRKKKGRLGDLTASTSTNNAILMKIGGWVFIEFSEIGTACRAMRLNSKTQGLGKSSYALTDLRHTGEQWIHMPSPTWEDKFLKQLGDKGITPDGVVSDRLVSGRPSRVIGASSKAISDEDPMLDEIKAFGMRVVDNRAKGGTVWVYGEQGISADVAKKLHAMGFRFKESKGGYYLQ